MSEREFSPSRNRFTVNRLFQGVRDSLTVVRFQNEGTWYPGFGCVEIVASLSGREFLPAEIGSV